VDLGLGGRVYVMAGASRGLGYAAAEILVAEGARVVVSGRDADAATRAAMTLGGPLSAVGVSGDNANTQTAACLVEAALEAYGRLDGALVSGAWPQSGGLGEVTDDEWRAGFESVFLGSLRIARAVAEQTRADGSIAFVVSPVVRIPIPWLAISSGLRPGLAMVAKLLAEELGPRGVRVNSLLPCGVLKLITGEVTCGFGDPECAWHDHRPCCSDCCISSCSGCLAGLDCLPAVAQPRTSRSSSCATKSPYCAAR
jgi:3-oxoacyl-[acyl-carrier protein] reductase